jgi:hypothetical protein
MSHKIINPAVVIFLVFAAGVIFSCAMTQPVARDEQMYCSGAILMSQGQTPYKDFSYVAQLPYYPLLLSAIYKITGTTHYLLTARIVSCIADFLTVLFTILIFRKIFYQFPFSGLFFGLAAATLLLFNPLIHYITGLAWNHNIVICLVVISFYLYLPSGWQTGPGYWRTAALAALLTFAACMRITTILILFIFFIAVIFRKFPSAKEKKFNILIFVFTSVLVFAWPLWIIAQSPRAFFLNLISIPELNGLLLIQMGLFYPKFRFAYNILTSLEFLFPILIVCYLYVLMFNRPQDKKSSIPVSIIFLALSLPAAFLIIAFIPITIWLQYLAIPIPFLLISLAIPLLSLREMADSAHLKIASFLLAACVVVTILQQTTILKPIAALSSPQSWQPMRLHNLSVEIAEKIDKSAPVLTIAPLYALEGSCRIYPQLSSGLFTYRIADNLTDDQRRITKTVGPASLKQLLQSSPPSAVIAGTEQGSGFDNLESTLLTAVSPGWSSQTFGNGILVYTK